MTGGISWADNEGSTLSRNTERRAMVRLESILERDNLNKAMRQVIANCSDPLNQQSLIGFFAKTGGNP